MASSSSRSLRAAALTALVAALSTSTAALAAPNAADRETARALVKEGKEHKAQNDLEGALKAFKGADAIMHVTTTGMLVARTLVDMGRLVDARDTAVRVARIPPEPNEPKAFSEARTSAEQLANELQPKIPTLKVDLKGVDPDTTTAKVVVDEEELGAAAFVAPRMMNPGHHVVVAKLGGQDRSQEIDLAEGDKKVITLDLTGLEPGSRGGAGVADGASGGAEVEPPDEAAKRKTSPLVYLGFGVGAVGLVVGAVTGVITLSKKSSLADSCPDGKCPPSTYDDLDSANTFATVSTIGFVAAGVGVAVGVVGLVVGGKKTPEPANKAPAEAARAKLRVSPWIGPGSAGVAGVF